MCTYFFRLLEGKVCAKIENWNHDRKQGKLLKYVRKQGQRRFACLLPEWLFYTRKSFPLVTAVFLQKNKVEYDRKQGGCFKKCR